MITIRPAKAAEEEEIRVVDELSTATLRETYRPKKGVSFPAVERKGPITCVVATAKGRVVGAVRYWVEEGRFHLYRLGVHPTFRRQGAAKGLIEYVADAARAAGARCLSLYTVRETGNVGIFERLGFKVIREEEDIYDESEKYPVLTDVYMEKMLERENR